MIIRYVNPAAAPDGDGTTPNLTSDDNTHAFQTRQQWAEARINSAGTLTDVERCVVQGTGIDSVRCIIGPVTTSSTAYPEIFVDDNTYNADYRHHGHYKEDAAKHNHQTYIKASYTRVTGEQKDYAHSGYHGFYITDNYSNVLVDSCVIRATGWNANGVYFSSNYGSNNVVQNCIAYDCGANGFYGRSGTKFINCTAVDNTQKGFYTVSGGYVLNCLADSNGTGDFALDPNTTGQNVVSGDATGDDQLSTNAYIDGVFTFAERSNDNFTLDPSDSATYGARTRGTATGAPTLDIKGHTRGSTVDIGAHNVSSE